MTAPAGRPIFVIGVGNTGVHVYRDAPSLVDTKAIHSGNAGSFEFFDVQGRRLNPEFDASGLLSELRDAGAPLNVALVQSKLCSTCKSLADSVDTRLVDKGATGYTREQALSYLPDLNGKPLSDCYVDLNPIFGHGSGTSGGVSTQHNGSWWHNFWAH